MSVRLRLDEPSVRRWLATLLVLLAAAWSGGVQAQVVRGLVTQSTSAAPIVGALVELQRADSTDVRVASALTDAGGGFALRAPSPGRYRVRAKRIGVRRYTSDPFTLDVGETRTMPIVLEALEYRLPEVVVSANTLCTLNPGDRTRVASLWEEARTALEAAEISLRDKLFSAEVTRYVRELEPKTLRIVNETRSDVRGMVASPFNSIPPESLSAFGYWRGASGGGAYYYGPDTRVMLSDAFLSDHCFRPVSGRGGRQGLTGLAFAPVQDRSVPDVVGTLWLDARTYELRLVEFAYDRLREGVDSTAVGGELHFARLANGAWLVRRWFLRVPVLGRPNQPVSTEGSAPWILVRPTMLGLSEEGGSVTTDEQRPASQPASIAGVVRDSTGKRALRGAVVRVAGSGREVTTDSLGRFALEGFAEGAVTLVMNASGYDTLGLAAADVSLELGGGELRKVTLTAHGARELTTRLCQGRAAPWGRGTVHVTVRDSARGAVRAGERATLQWMSTAGRPAGDSVSVQSTGETDVRGNVTFCEVPSDRTLTFRVARPNGAAAALVRTSIRGREVRHLDVTVEPTLPNE